MMTREMLDCLEDVNSLLIGPYIWIDDDVIVYRYYWHENHIIMVILLFSRCIILIVTFCIHSHF